MIEINLITEDKSFKLPTIVGFDLSHINVKMLVFAFILSYAPELFLDNFYITKKEEARKDVKKVKQILKKLKSKTKGHEKIQAQIEKVEIQEQYFNNTFEVVKNILKTKKSPFNMMLYIVKNIPDDLWLLSTNLKNDKLTLEGNAISFGSIGILVENLKKSIFFGGNVRIKSSQTFVDKKTNKRVETFKIIATISRYN